MSSKIATPFWMSSKKNKKNPTVPCGCHLLHVGIGLDLDMDWLSCFAAPMSVCPTTPRRRPGCDGQFHNHSNNAIRSLYLLPASPSRGRASEGPVCGGFSSHGPFIPTALAADTVLNFPREGVVRLPVHFLPVGRMSHLTPVDPGFLRFTQSSPSRYSSNFQRASWFRPRASSKTSWRLKDF